VTGRALIAAGILVLLMSSHVMGAPVRRGKPRSRPAVARETPPEPPRPPARSPAVVEHEVAKAETLGAIAKKYRVTVSSLVIANRLKGPRAKLAVGQRLTIPRPGAAPLLRARRGPIEEPLPVSLVLGVPDFDEAPSFLWPVAGPVTSTFGRRSHSWHRGIDIRADAGTPIIASAPGVVIASGFEPRYGLMVKIEHDGGFVTVYAHNERNVVDAGDEVAAGQTIARVGRTGRATGDHVHFEIRYDGRVYNPLYLLPLPPRSVHVEVGAPDQQDDDE
jgi:lipoprotein NlpD